MNIPSRWIKFKVFVSNVSTVYLTVLIFFKFTGFIFQSLTAYSYASVQCALIDTELSTSTYFK